MDKEEIVKILNIPIVKGMIGIMPGGAFAGSIIQDRIQNFHKERFNRFIELLSIGEIQVDEKDLESEEFVYNYISTAKAVINSRRIEKIKYFANFFESSINQKIIFEKNDRYESFLKIIDELTSTEVQLLIQLSYYEDQFGSRDKSRQYQLKLTEKYWDSFKKDFKKITNLPLNFMYDTLVRMERTACINVPRKTSNSYTKANAVTSDIFHELKKLILDEN